MKKFKEEIIYLPWFGDIHIHQDIKTNKLIRVYVYDSELKKSEAESGVEFLDDMDEKILFDPRNYKKCKNSLYVDLKKKYIERMESYLERYV